MNATSVRAFAVGVAMLAIAPVARGEPGRAHHHHDETQIGTGAHGDPYAGVLGGHHHGARTLSVSLGAVAANYDMRLFTGRYQGLTAAVGGGVGRFGFLASLTAYQLDRNGRRETGLGDAMLHAHAAIVQRSPWSAGVGAMISAPTGSEREGLGMGHTMLMPDAWIRWRRGRIVLAGSVGYGRALGGASAHAAHGGGGMPLVAPMNASEVTQGADVTIAVHPRVALGLNAAAALPIGDGAAPASGGVFALWMVGSVLASIDLQRGLVGDPFGSRVTAAATFRFE